jgi:hypothetical protein
MLSRMRELEPYLADVIEAVARRDLAMELGPRTVRDARDVTGLRVNFTYEQSAKALEVTTIPDDDAAVLSEVTKLADRLSKDMAGWLVVLKSSAQIKALEDALISVLETGREIRPGAYSSSDVEHWAAQGQLQERLEDHRHLEGLGIVEIVRRGDPTSIVCKWRPRAMYESSAGSATP